MFFPNAAQNGSHFKCLCAGVQEVTDIHWVCVREVSASVLKHLQAFPSVETGLEPWVAILTNVIASAPWCPRRGRNQRNCSAFGRLKSVNRHWDEAP